jgi:hypothetical protein
LKSSMFKFKTLIVCVSLLLSISAMASQDIANRIVPIIMMLLGDDESSIKKGVLIDSETSGVKYRTSSGIIGTTTLNGEYEYKDGDTIEFFIGNEIKMLGSVTATALTSVLEFENPVQVAVLLQSLDHDGNPNNGIQISEEDALIFSSSNISIQEVNADDSAFRARFKSQMGFPVTQDNFAATDHAIQEVKYRFLEKFDKGFIDALNGKIESPQLLGYDSVTNTVFGEDPNDALHSLEANLRHYLFNRSIGPSMQNEFDILMQEQWDADYSKAKLQNTSENIVAVIGLRNLLRSGATSSSKMLRASKLTNQDEAFKFSVNVMTDFVVDEAADKLVKAMAETIPDNSNSRVLKKMLSACTLVLLVEPEGCITQSGATLIELIYNADYLKDKSDRLKSTRNLQLAFYYLSYYYSFYDSNRSDFFRNEAITNLFNGLSEKNGGASFTSFKQEDHLSDAINVLARELIYDRFFVSLEYDFDEVKGIVESYQRIIDDHLLPSITDALDDTILASIENNYLLPIFELDQVNETGYRVCVAFKNVSSSKLENIVISMGAFWLNGDDNTALNSVTLELPVDGSTDEKCTQKLTTQDDDLLSFFDVLKTVYQANFTVQRTLLEAKEQSGEKLYEVSRSTIVNSVVYPLIRITAPVFLEEGDELVIDATDTFILTSEQIDLDPTAVFEWEYVPSANVPSLNFIPLNDDGAAKIHALEATVPFIDSDQELERLRFKLTVTANFSGRSSEKYIDVFIKQSDAEEPGITDGLVAHYKFEGDATDSTGRGNNAEAQNGVAYSAGKIGLAAKLDGVDDFITIPNANDLNFGGLQPFTFSAWIKPDRYQGVIISKFNSGVIGEHIFGIRLDGEIYAHRETQPFSTTGTTNLGTNSFSHVVSSYDGQTLSVWVNGIREAQITMGSSNSTNQQTLIGAWLSRSNLAAFFDGLIDDVRIYNRSLSNEEIISLATQ